MYGTFDDTTNVRILIYYDCLVPIDVQLMLRLMNSYLGLVNSKNPIVTLYSKLCPYNNTAAAKNKRYVILYLK